MSWPTNMIPPSFLELAKLLPIVGPTVASTAEFVERFSELISHRGPGEQAELREMLEDVQADNDAGHARLQEKLARAAER
jgi:hypothetical protein